jgi:glycosyltransferase involved in cell wall biosynthesis
LGVRAWTAGHILPHFQRVNEDPAAPANDDAPVLYFGRLSAEKGISDLCFLIADREIREDAGRSAKRRIADHYLWPKVTGEIEQVYLEMLGRKGAVSRSPSTSGDLQEANPSKRDLVA